MIRFIGKLIPILILTFLIIWLMPVVSVGADTLSLTADKTELELQEKVTITVRELDENGQPVAVDTVLTVKISRGGIIEPGILKSGLPLKNGTGKFGYIAPSKPGDATILVLNPATNLSQKLVLTAIEKPVQTTWRKEFAVITKVKGNAAIKYSGNEIWDSALVDTKLREQDTIMTWEKSWVTLKLYDNSEITLQPGSSLYIKSLQSSNKLKRSLFKLITGKVLAKAKEYLEKGSKFEIESESATAGVRGTFFEFGTWADGTSQLIVYEGTVFFEQLLRELIFQVNQGQSIASGPSGEIPDPNSHNITPEARDKALEDEENAADQTTTAGTSNATEETNKNNAPSGGGNIGVFFGSERVGNQTYLMVHVQPEFKKVFGSAFGVGLDLVLYQDPVSGEFTFCSPRKDVVIGNFINWVDYSGKHLFLHYGYMTDITYDFGLMFGEYHKDLSRGMQFGLKDVIADGFGFKILAPFDIKAFSPWIIEPTSTLYAARMNFDFNLAGLPFGTGVTYVTDTNNDLKNLSHKVPVSGLAADFSLKLTELSQPYIEVANLNDFGSGAELGIRGKLLIFNYQTGLRYLDGKFIPNYFGGDYEEYKLNTLRAELPGLYPPPTPVTGRKLPDLSAAPVTSGYYFDLKARIGSYVSFRLGYENYQDAGDYAPVVTANLDAKAPQIGFVSPFSAGFKYRQEQFGNNTPGSDLWLNCNTFFMWYVSYPIKPGLLLTLTNTFIPSDAEISFSRGIGLSMMF
jgi:hypothetical protein